MDPLDDIVEPAPPERLTVEEASKVMRIGRQLAYDLANDDLASGGTQGALEAVAHDDAGVFDATVLISVSTCDQYLAPSPPVPTQSP
jgi:hypothetical protein